MHSFALAQPAAWPPEMLADAELTSVCFVDADRGWAVGDRGVIWHSADGGRTWNVQRSPVTCRLESVQFFDGENGWAVGGWTQPYTHETRGVVLRTRDGGRSWQVIPDLMLPAIKFARFFDPKRGWAVGEASPLYPAGVFRTEDGGRAWIPVAKGQTTGWVTADFRDVRGGILAGRNGDLAIATQVELRTPRTQNIGTRYLRRLVLAGDSGGWLVGDGGLVMTTSDGGFTWTAPSGALPDGAARDFDFRAVATLGNHCWIAGSPGTCVLHSHDGGRTWNSYRTDQKLPIRALTFVDENRGWAVGSLGMILATRDGGRTWREQRSGGTRAALLGIFSEPSRIPLEVFAQQSGNEGFLGVAEVIGRTDRDGHAGDEASLPDRSHEALIAVGASLADTAWRFPLRQRGLAETPQAIMEFWNQANDGKAAEAIEEHLVRRIRTWRPEVIITEDVSPHGKNPLAHLTNQTVLSAVEKAADATAYSDQLTLTGLEPWRVKKVIAVKDKQGQGLTNVPSAQWAPRMARSLADAAEEGRSLLTHEVQTGPPSTGLAMLVDHLPQQTGRRDVFSGIGLLPGGEARRKLSNPPPGDLDAFVKAAQKRHNVQQLISRLEQDENRGASWLGQIDDLTKGLGDRGAAEILHQLATRYQRAGKSEYAAEVMTTLLQRHPQHPLADAAATWLMHYYTSGEAAWRQRGETRYTAQLATATLPLEEKSASKGALLPGEDNKTELIPAADIQSQIRTAGSTTTASPGLSPSERAGRAIALGKSIERTRPPLYADPAFRIPLAVAYRQHGQPRQSEKLLATLTAMNHANAWTSCAAAEQWLAKPTPATFKKLLPCQTAATRPRLDGRLDDAVWQQAKSASLIGLHQSTEDLPTAVVLAFDNEFLYLAASCKKGSGLIYPVENLPRTHDTDLSSHDRIEICLDVDRDYASYWKLAIDSRGCTAESCFGDATWNPLWFVAAGGDSEYWTIEAAMPLAELSPKPPQVRDVWAVGVQRIIPSVGLQSFTAPAHVDVRSEGFGLLSFE